jgi:hypothetical protein
VRPESLSSRKTKFYTKRLYLLASQEGEEEDSFEIFATVQSIPTAPMIMFSTVWLA